MCAPILINSQICSHFTTGSVIGSPAANFLGWKNWLTRPPKRHALPQNFIFPAYAVGQYLLDSPLISNYISSGKNATIGIEKHSDLNLVA